MTPKGPSQDAQLERAIGVIRELRLRLESLESGRNEPVAIIGMACRFPGGCDTPALFWRLTASGGDAVTQVPGDRAGHWRDADPIARHGGFLERVDLFDPEFFGIAPREAERMDPQQRLMMEVAWEAMEDAGQDLGRLRGSRTGVFAGIHSAANDYFQFQISAPGLVDTYTGTGCGHDVVAGRLNYAFDWRGPAMAVNTACSSSLVAVHLACQSLRSGDSNLALAAGVNLILSPGFSLAVEKLGMLSPGGRCHAFDERADGFVRGEGCGAVVLKRLSDALRDGDPIRAVIRGSAVNQDGRSNGLSAPNGLAQEEVIRRALERAGVAPEAIGYVEAHGTGTALGDPIEFDALSAVVIGGPGCALGSAKANVGHLEACAGVAGLIKAVLCLENETIPPLALFQKLNPHIRLEGTPFIIPRELTAWPRGTRKRFAGVSSFGWSGTNAHVVLEEAPRQSAPPAAPVDGLLLPVSAHTPAALRDRAGQYAAHLATLESNAIADFCYSVSCRRTHHQQRLAVFRRSAAELAETLRVFSETGSSPGLVHGRARSERPGVAFVFTGQGGHWWGMGRELLETSGVFRQVIERCAECLSRVAGWDLMAELRADEAVSRLSETQYAQPALFALQAGLVAMWREWGCEPAAVVGHSVGEIAAAYTAGALALEEAVRIVAHRGRVMQRGTGRGGMVSVAAGIESLRPLLAGLEDRVAIAAMNSPASSVLSGDNAVLDALVARLTGQGVVCRPLRVDCAFHSPHMDVCRDELAAVLGAVKAKDPQVSFVSTVTGSAIQSGQELSAAYWARGVREPVRFASAVSAILESGIELFLQIGPHPVLSAPIVECGEAANKPAKPIASLRRGMQERESMLRAAGDLYVSGCGLDWSKIAPAGRPVSLPAYPWQRKRYWLPDSRPNWRYEIAWEPQALPDDDTLPPSETERGADLERLAVSYAAKALEDLHGDAPAAGHFGCLLRRMRDAQSRDREGALPAHPEELAAALLRRYPEHRAEFDLLIRCGRELANVMRGKADALELLFPADSSSGAAAVYANSPVSRFYNRLVSKAALTACSGRRARVLEIGAGTGATTEALLEVLPANAEYVFTDVSRLLLSDAAARFRGRTNLRFRTLDIERDPAAQGFEASSFDLIVCANVLHATADLRASLRHIRSLLAPGGVFVLLEVVAPRLWADLTFGLTEGWWRFRDTDLRPDYPLLDERRWVELLRESGFPSATATAAHHSAGAAFQQCLFLSATTIARPSEWLIAGDDSPLAPALLEAIQGSGGHCTVQAGARDHHGPVICLCDRAAEDPAGSQCSRLLAVVKALGPGSKLWVITRGAQPAEQPVSHPAAAPVWGLGRVIALEHPEIWGGLIDAGPQDDAETVARAVVREILAQSAEDQIALRAGRRYVARLRRAAEQSVQQVRLDPAGVYVITGGLGTVGPKIARWILEHGGRRLVLIGRTGMGTGEIRKRRARIVEQLRARGAEVEVIAADVSDEEAMRPILAKTGIRGICHAAVDIELRSLRDATADTLSKTFKPKAHGAWILHKLSMDLRLDFFLLFSSAAAAIGARNMGEYAAANEYLDALASYRLARQLPAVALDWGAWDQIGSVSEEEKKTVMRAGFRPMPEPDALEAMNTALQSKLPRSVVADIDWQVLKSAMEARGPRPFLDEVDAAPAPLAPAAIESPLLETLAAAATPGERRDIAGERIRRELRAILGLEGSAHIEPDRGFFSMGMDSLMAVQFRRAMEAATGLSFPNSLTFNHPNIDALTKHVLAALGYGQEEKQMARRDRDDDLTGLSEPEIERLLAAEARSLAAELDS